VQIYHFASDENYAVSWLEGIEGTKWQQKSIMVP
jgi:hypothetical protein